MAVNAAHLFVVLMSLSVIVWGSVDGRRAPE